MNQFTGVVEEKETVLQKPRSTTVMINRLHRVSQKRMLHTFEDYCESRAFAPSTEKNREIYRKCYDYLH